MSAGGDELFWHCGSLGASLGEGVCICSEQIYVKRNDKIGQTGCDNQDEACLPRAAGEMCRGRRRGC